jgi:hypothetical protein
MLAAKRGVVALNLDGVITPAASTPSDETMGRRKPSFDVTPRDWAHPVTAAHKRKTIEMKRVHVRNRGAH